MAVSQPGMYLPQNAGGPYPQFNAVNQPAGMGPQAMPNNTISNDFAQPNMETPTQFQSSSSQQVSPVQMTDTMDGQSTLGNTANPSYDPALYDPTDPSLFLDPSVISDLNFGNHYGALEFGMLDQMSSAVLGSGELDGLNSMGSISYDGSFNPGFGLNQNFQPWNSIPNPGSRQNSMNNNFWGMQSNGMDAFAVGEHTGSLTGASPHSQNQDYGNQGYQSSNTASPEQQGVQSEQTHQNELLRQSITQAQQKQQSRKGVFPTDPVQAGLKKQRRRDTSQIYESVQSPYPYTQAFHGATAFLQNRYPSAKVLKIAKALSNVRPSFISCQQNLTREDLIFTEQCFQRSLVEYEDYLNHYGCPTLICRRTMEVAAVSKEFSLLTNWRRDVLLGKEANLNVNMDGTGSGTQTGTSSRGAMTPRVPAGDTDTGARPHGVLLAELLDEDSMVKLYEDYGEVAFSSERDKIVGETCSLMKYKTKDDPGWGMEERGKDNAKQGKGKSEALMRGEAGMNALGEKDGRIQCGLAWQVKRDMFDMPMLLVLNVSCPLHDHADVECDGKAVLIL